MPARLTNNPVASQNGIALVLVLWVLSLLTVMALSLTVTQRSQHALTQNQLDAARFRALADGAVNIAILNLMAEPMQAVASDQLWLPDGSPHEINLGEEVLQVQVFNEASRIDLNQIDQHQLQTLLELAGAPQQDTPALVGAILDWRDPDSLISLNGAEDSDYRAAGYPHGAADEDFSSVEELMQVMGMTAALFRALESDLRVSSASGGQSRGPVFGAGGGNQSPPFDARFASPRALAAMQSLTIERAEQIAAERDQLALDGATGFGRRDRGGPDYRVRVTLRRGNQSARALEVVLQLDAQGRAPFQFNRRREALLTNPPEQE